MKKSLIFILFIMLSGCSQVGKWLIIEKEIPGSFDDVTMSLERKIAAKNWEVSKVFDFQKTLLEKRNHDIGLIRAYKVCQPDHALALLKNENNKAISAMMPCSISVYTKDKKTYISYLNLNLMKIFFNEEVSVVMSQVGKEIESIIGE